MTVVELTTLVTSLVGSVGTTFGDVVTKMSSTPVLLAVFAVPFVGAIVSGAGSLFSALKGN